MPPELVDANTQQVPATFDTQEFARTVSQQLAQSLKDSTPKQQEDEIRDVVAQLKAAGLEDSDIQAHISTALGLDKRMSRLLDERTQKATQDVMIHLQRKELNSTVGRVVRSYSKDDELVQVAAPAIREQALAEFINGTSSQIVSARNKFLQTGELDEDIIDTIVSNHVKRLDQAVQNRSGKKSQATPTIGGSDTTARPATDNDVTNIDVKNLTPIQETVYNAHRSQMLRTGKTAEEAEQLARAAAARIKK